ncbi:MAG: response regulator transcription factor [Chloroflexi bacterium]|nr:response regulator transcription factor [Chloroflexota bacterium]
MADEKKPIRVLIADDHGVVREGLRMLLEQAGFDVVALAATGNEAVRLALEHKPDVVLLDIRMPDGDGLQALAQIKAQLPNTAVLILTTYDNPTYLAQAVNLGAAGFLTKDTDPQNIPLAVRAVVSGEALVDLQVLQRVLNNLRAGRDPLDTGILSEPEPESGRGAETQKSGPLPEDLTDQEVRVLRLIAQGMSNQEIADRLHISLNTVKTHIKHIFSKLGVSDRTQAAVWAWRHGLGE